MKRLRRNLVAGYLLPFVSTVWIFAAFLLVGFATCQMQLAKRKRIGKVCAVFGERETKRVPGLLALPDLGRFRLGIEMAACYRRSKYRRGTGEQ